MNKENVELMAQAVTKYYGFLCGSKITTGPSNCGLCHEYRKVDEYSCCGCPVKIKTGHDFCRNTPYGTFESVLELLSYIRSEEQLIATLREFFFLLDVALTT